jgi:phage tail protein X
MPKRYSKIGTTVTDTGRRYRFNAVFPEIPETDTDIYVVTTAGDRLDNLAQQYYGDSTLWWIIAVANSNINKASIIPTPGVQIRIPGNKQAVIGQYNELNSTR